MAKSEPTFTQFYAKQHTLIAQVIEAVALLSTPALDGTSQSRLDGLIDLAVARIDTIWTMDLARFKALPFERQVPKWTKAYWDSVCTLVDESRCSVVIYYGEHLNAALNAMVVIDITPSRYFKTVRLKIT